MILLSKYNMLIMLACMKLPRVCINVVIFKNKNGLYMLRMCVCVLVTPSCPTLCNPMDCSLPVHGILQARTLEWVAISFSSVNFSTSSIVAKLCPTLVTPQTVAYHVPLSMGFSRQEHWSGLPFPSPICCTHMYTYRAHTVYVYMLYAV